MIREIYFLNDAQTGLKILVYEDVSSAESRGARRAHQQLLVQSGFCKLLEDDRITLAHQISGAPFLPLYPELHISISHSHNYYALIMHPNNAVGIDIQKKREAGFPSALHYFLTEEEATIPSSEHALYLLWCAKEALYKRQRGDLKSYKEDLQIHGISSGIILASVKDEFVTCSHLLLPPDLVLVYCA